MIYHDFINYHPINLWINTKMTTKLIERLQALMLSCTNEPSKKDLTAAVTKVFKDKAGKAKEEKNSEDKPKRKPSAYNNFYREQSAVLKQIEESKPKEERMSAKDKMSYIASLWRDAKEQKAAADEDFQDPLDGEEDPEATQEEEEEAEEPSPPPKKGGNKQPAAKAAEVGKKKKDEKNAKKETKKGKKHEKHAKKDETSDEDE
jgi:hypothetical protein